MRILRSCVLATAASLSLVLAALPASADVAPGNLCNDAGEPCNTAPTESGGYNGAGLCASTTCPHTTIEPDGGFSVSENPCTLCLATDGGPVSASSSSGSSSGGSSGGSSGSSSGSSSGGSSGSSSGGSGSSGGCAVGAVRADTVAPFALMGVGAVILGLSRRKRDRR